MNPEFTARYFRAALALRGWRVQDLADAVPEEYRLSKRTLDEVSRGRRVPRDWEYRLFAEHLEVPEAFLRNGFDEGFSLGAADQEAIAAALESLTAALRPLLLPADQQGHPPVSGSSARRPA